MIITFERIKHYLYLGKKKVIYICYALYILGGNLGDDTNGKQNANGKND